MARLHVAIVLLVIGLCLGAWTLGLVGGLVILAWRRWGCRGWGWLVLNNLAGLAEVVPHLALLAAHACVGAGAAAEVALWRAWVRVETVLLALAEQVGVGGARWWGWGHGGGGGWGTHVWLGGLARLCGLGGGHWWGGLWWLGGLGGRRGLAHLGLVLPHLALLVGPWVLMDVLAAVCGWLGGAGGWWGLGAWWARWGGWGTGGCWGVWCTGAGDGGRGRCLGCLRSLG